MSDANVKFGTMLNCMDGRTQEPVLNWMREQFKVDIVDSPNPAGPTNLILNGDESVVEHYKNEVLISLNGHGSRNLVVVAHQDCAANPISDDEQIEQLKKSCALIEEKWDLPEEVTISGLWLTKENDLKWHINCLITLKTKAKSLA